MTITLELIADQLAADGHYDMEEFVKALSPSNCINCIYWDTEESTCICPEDCSVLAINYFTQKEYK